MEALLRREDALRLHPKVQAAYTLIGESEDELSRFTTALQAHVASELCVDAPLGIDLIRSASVLFPDVAQIAHYTIGALPAPCASAIARPMWSW